MLHFLTSQMISKPEMQTLSQYASIQVDEL